MHTQNNLTVVIIDICALANTSLFGLQLHRNSDPSRRFVDEAHQSLRGQRNMKLEDPWETGTELCVCVCEEAKIWQTETRQSGDTHLAQRGDVRAAGMNPSSMSEQPPFQASCGQPRLLHQPWLSGSACSYRGWSS